MAPADFKEWWLAAVALSATTGVVQAQDAEKAGVVTGQQGTSRSLGAPGVPGEHVVYMGDPTYRFERIKSDAGATTHIMLLDQSSLTLGPNSELVLDEFVYDPQGRKGSIKVNLLRGVLRVVGGEISKNTATEVKTPLATIGIRGGISVIEQQENKTSSVFLFGESMSMTSPDGSQSQTVTRQGFGMTSEGGALSGPNRVPSSDVSTLLSRLEAPSGGTPDGGTGNTQPGGAPPGQLMATGNRSGQDPATGLSPERLDTAGDRMNVGDPQQRQAASGTDPANNTDALRNLLTTKPTNQS